MDSTTETTGNKENNMDQIVIRNLDGLLEAMLMDQSDVVDSHGREWRTDLPTFGGDDMAGQLGVWSWDETRAIVGTCADDLTIMLRHEFAA